MRNKFITLLSFLILLGGSLCYGQENSINVNGIVTDSLTQIGIPYATVEFVSQGSTEQRGGFVADEEGRFSQHFSIPGEYRLTVRSVGYKTKLLTIEVHQGTNRVDTIRLFPDTQELGEVKVVARRKLRALSPKGLTYDMKNDVLAQTDNLLFALRNVPLVSVDGEGNIRVKGSSNFSVYINGTPSRVASMNPTEVLRGIPANTIKRVEVITQLDARYDASAGDAILNIITDRKTLDGYSATISLAGTTIPTANGATTLTLTKGKLSVALAYNYDYTRHKDQPVDVYRRTFEGDKTIDEFRSSQKNGVGIFRNHVGNLMGEYALDSLNTIYADGHIFVSSTNDTGTNKQTFSRLGVPTQYSSLNNKMNYTEGSVEGNLLYRNLYAESKEPRFSIGYRYAYNPDKRYNDITERQYRNGFSSWEESTYDETRRKQISRGGLSEHALQGDYQKLWSNGHALQLGVKDVLRLGSSKPEYHHWDYNRNEWQRVDNPLYRLGDMSQLQNVASAYVNYTMNKGSLGVNAGLRGELVYDRITFSQNPSGNFERKGIDLIPSIGLTCAVSNSQQLAFSYKMKPIRPSIWVLNPYKSQSNPYELSFGNPELESELHHGLDLSYTLFSNKYYFNLNAGYTHTNNAIMPIQYWSTENSNVLCRTYDNAGMHRVPNLSFWVNWRPLMPLSLLLHGNFKYHLFDYDVQNIHQRSWENLMMAAIDVTLPKSWFLGASWYCNTNPPMLRTTYSYSHFYSFYAKKSFWDNKLDLTLTVNHPFSQYLRFETKTWGSNFVHSQVNMIQSRSLGLKLTYNFHSGKSREVSRDESLSTSDLDRQTGVR